MSAVCPACGVPVVSGYVKCPKCHAALPYGRGKRSTLTPSGTALPERAGFPVAAIVAALLVAGGIAAFFGLRGGKSAPAAPAPDDAAPLPVAPAPGPAPTAPTPAATPSAAPAPRVDAASAAAELERALRAQRLWSSVVPKAGNVVDVRSNACGDPALASIVTALHAHLRDAGLTEVRCLEQSGAVVWKRDL